MSHKCDSYRMSHNRNMILQIGAHIRRVTADQIKKVSLELGGKNPAIVFGDADIDKGKDITRLALDTSDLIQKSFSQTRV